MESLFSLFGNVSPPSSSSYITPFQFQNGAWETLGNGSLRKSPFLKRERRIFQKAEEKRNLIKFSLLLSFLSFCYGFFRCVLFSRMDLKAHFVFLTFFFSAKKAKEKSFYSNFVIFPIVGRPKKDF